MKKLLFQLVIGFWILAGVTSAPALQPTTSPVELPGLRKDGSVLLPNQWSLRPVGRQVPMGDFPVNIAVHLNGRYAAVVHSGFGPHEIIVVDVKAAKVVSRTPVHETFYGLEFAHSGGRLYCSGSSDEVVHVFDFKDGKLTENGEIRVCPAKERGIPSGMALSENARDLYVANVWGQCVSHLDLLARTNVADFSPIAGQENVIMRKTAVEPQFPPDPELQPLTKREEALLDPTKPDAPFPYACRLDDKRHLLYVSLWARACVAVIDLKSNKVKTAWATEEHPNEMILTKSRRYLFVANANRNTVTVIDTEKGKTVETLYASFTQDDLPGSTPCGLALTPDEKMLFVANACNNNVAVFDVSDIGHSRAMGFIPVGWYPTSVRVTPDGKHLLVANGKGLISKANPLGPQPNKKSTEQTQKIDDLFPGTLSIIDIPGRTAFWRKLTEYTAEAYRCTPQKTVEQVTPAADNPVWNKSGKESPIKHVFYVIKENRTYDQVLGDMKEGNGDSNLCLFPERVSPNHHKLARDFVLLDNFYVDAEVSADGHEWSMGAYASDFVEKTWPFNYRHSHKFPYPSEGRFPIADPAGGYLWDRAAEAGVSYFSFGEFVFNGATPDAPCFTRTKSMKGHFDLKYHAFDMNYPDSKRAARFLEVMKKFEAEGLPQLVIVRLPSDHTAGVVVGKPTPTAYMGDNDRSLGLVVEAISHSRFWPETAIFVLEDDAQNGPDHVDAHRSPAFVISPYTKRHAVDSTMYSTSSTLHTIELILGLKPMTQFDAAATPMFNAFTGKPDYAPYDALPANVDLNAVNTARNRDARESEKMDFSQEDLADDKKLNEIIWRSVRGQDSAMPAPTRAAFVHAQPKKDED
jgi:DNA-binding beta-propeller fold protein YncE